MLILARNIALWKLTEELVILGIEAQMGYSHVRLRGDHHAIVKGGCLLNSIKGKTNSILKSNYPNNCLIKEKCRSFLTGSRNSAQGMNPVKEHAATDPIRSYRRTSTKLKHPSNDDVRIAQNAR